MRKDPNSPAPATPFERGAPLVPADQLSAWLDSTIDPDGARVVRVPIVLARGPVGHVLRGATIGGDPAALVVNLGDAALGIGLAMRARRATGPVAAFLVEGRWHRDDDGHRLDVVRTGDPLDAGELAAITHAEVAAPPPRVKGKPDAPPPFVRGIALTPTAALVDWLDAHPQLLRFPLVLSRESGQWDISTARIGEDPTALVVYANDSALGEGLADRAFGSRTPTCAFLVHGYWRGRVDDRDRVDVVRVESKIALDDLAAVSYVEVADATATP